MASVQELLTSSLREKFYISTDFVKTNTSPDEKSKETQIISQKFKTFQYFFLLGEVGERYYLKVLDYDLNKLFVKSTSSDNLSITDFLEQSFNNYQSTLFFEGNIVKEKGPNTFLVKIKKYNGSVIGKPVTLYPSSLLKRDNNKQFKLPKGVITERQGAFHLVQVVNIDNIPIQVGDHLKVSKTKKSIKTTRNSLIQDGKSDDNLENFDITYKKFGYIFPYQRSLFQCHLLPFVTNLSDDKSETTKNYLIDFLKEEKICQQKINKEIENILESRKKSIKEDLFNPEILKVISKKLSAGTLLRVSLLERTNGYYLKLEAIAQDGKTIIFKKNKVVGKNQLETVANLLGIWSKEYRDSIPYIALVEEVVGEELLISIGENQTIGNVQHYEIYRPEGLKIESFEDIYKVSWQKKRIGSGSIKNVKAGSAIAYVRNTIGEERVKVGDWIVLNKNYILGKDDHHFVKHNLNITGRENARIQVAAEISELRNNTGSDGQSNNGFTENKVNWMGIDLGIEYFFPYSWIGIFNFKRIFGSGSFSSSASFFDGAIGYALKTPFKFTNFLDVFIGYKTQQYNVSELGGIGAGDIKISGPYVGARTEFPIYKKLSLTGGFKVAPIDSGSHSATVLEGIQSAFSLDGNLSANFKINDTISIYSGLTYKSHKIKLGIGATQTVQITVGNIGLLYFF